MAKTISCLLNNIVLGLDGILNKALKTYGPLIVPWLIDIARACFIIGYYLRLGRAIITFIWPSKTDSAPIRGNGYEPGSSKFRLRANAETSYSV